jgi:hypothetical protein
MHVFSATAEHGQRDSGCASGAPKAANPVKAAAMPRFPYPLAGTGNRGACGHE